MQPKKYQNPQIALLNIELELKAEKDNAEIRVDNVKVRSLEFHRQKGHPFLCHQYFFLFFRTFRCRSSHNLIAINRIVNYNNLVVASCVSNCLCPYTFVLCIGDSACNIHTRSDCRRHWSFSKLPLMQLPT